MTQPKREIDTDTDLQRGIEPLRTIFAVLVLLLGFAAGARAQSGFGSIDAHAHDGARFELVALESDIEVLVSGLVGEARIRQRFSNTSTQWIEAQYLLPLPDGAAVHALRVRIGERLIVGEIREKEQARAAYVEAAASGQRAALVEADRAQLFRTAVANVGPGETIEVEVRWSQSIAYRDGRFALELPLTYTPRYGAMRLPLDRDVQPSTTTDDRHGNAPRIDVRVEIQAGLTLARVESPTHAIAVNLDGARHAVQLTHGAVSADRDFVLEWTPALGQQPASALLVEQHDGDTYAMVMLVPRNEIVDALPRELILVIDTSGSMEGESMRQARAALDLALAGLTPRDRFNVIQFNSVTEALFDAAVPALPGDVRLAREWVARLRATGGTEMEPALRRALRDAPHPGSVRQVVFATDGAIADAARLYALIDAELGASRLFTVGIGSAPNTQFIERAATLGRGASITIRDLNDVGARMRDLFAKLDRPALRDLELSWPGAAEVYPRRLPDLYAGEPLLVVARLAQAHGHLHARGHMSTAPWSASLPLGSPANATGIARLWAQRKIDSLDQSLALGADAGQVRDQILELALAQSLITRYTSLIAVEKTPARPLDADLVSQRIANGAPAGAIALAATATHAPLQKLIGLLSLVLAAACALAARRRSRMRLVH